MQPSPQAPSAREKELRQGPTTIMIPVIVRLKKEQQENNEYSCFELDSMAAFVCKCSSSAFDIDTVTVK